MKHVSLNEQREELKQQLLQQQKMQKLQKKLQQLKKQQKQKLEILNLDNKKIRRKPRRIFFVSTENSIHESSLIFTNLFSVRLVFISGQKTSANLHECLFFFPIKYLLEIKISKPNSIL